MLYSAIALLIVILTSVFLKKKKLHSFFLITVFECFVIATFLFYISDMLTGEGINTAAIYQIKAGLQGTGFSDYFNQIALFLICIVLVMVVGFVYFQCFPRHHSQLLWGVWLILFGGYVVLFPWHNFMALYDSYFENSQYDELGREYYAQPTLRNINSRPNILFIYLESTERTYFSKNFPEYLLENTKNLAKDSVNFTNVRNGYSNGWTMGGIVGSQCGLPLKTPSQGNSMHGIKKFLPKAICLGDVLNIAGYTQTYLNGARLSFAGKGDFFRTHKFNNVLGYEYMKGKYPEVQASGWGYHDDIVFIEAESILKKWTNGDNPQAFFMLTLDAHHPDGLPSHSCLEKTKSLEITKLEKAIYCTDLWMDHFIRKIRQTEFGENAIVVVASDHLAMNSSKSIEKLKLSEIRTNLFFVNHPSLKSQTIDVDATTRDIGATLLDILGWNNKLGFGRSLLEDSLYEDREYIQNNIKSWNGYLQTFWGFPRWRKELRLSHGQIYAVYENYSIKRPMAIAFDKNKNTQIMFGGSGNLEPAPLESVFETYIPRAADYKSYFIAYDQCDTFNKISTDGFGIVNLRFIDDSRLCVAYGMYPEKLQVSELTEDLVLDSDKVIKLIDTIGK